MKILNLRGINDLRLEERDIPTPGEGEVLVEIHACGICSSDEARVLKTGTYHFPTVPGHEFCGKILLKPAADLVGTEGRRLAPSVDKKHIKFLKEISVIPGKAGEKSEIHGNGASGSPGLRLHRIESGRKERQHQHHHKAEIHRNASFLRLHLLPPLPLDRIALRRDLV